MTKYTEKVNEGETVAIIGPSGSGKFMSKTEAAWMMLKGSALLVGRK